MEKGWRLAPGGRAARTGRRGARAVVRDVVADRLLGRVGLRIRGREHVRIRAATLDGLAQAELSTQDVRRLTVTVVWWIAPIQGWTGRLGPLPGVRRERITLPKRGRGRATVDIELTAPAPLDVVVAAARHALRPFRPLPAPGPAVAVDAPRVTFDPTRVNPRGRRPDSYRRDAPAFRLGPADEPGHQPGGFGNPAPWNWPGTPRWRSIVDGDLSWATVAALRSVGSIEFADPSPSPDRDPRRAAELLVQLAGTGVLVHASTMDDRVGDLIAPELRRLLPAPLPDEPLEREARSVRQRRAALRGHTVRFGQYEPPSVSVILATRRPQFLRSALRAVAGQTYPNLEIVVGLHGIEAPDAAFLSGLGRPVQVVPAPPDMPFGEVLDIAAGRAAGEFVTKMDDDDTYSDEHVWDLVLARDYSGATLVGKGIEFVYLEGRDLTVRRWAGPPEWDTGTVAGGTLFLARDHLAEVGGWPHATRYEDRALLDRVAAAGGVIYRTHPLGYLYHRRAQGQAGHAWAADDDFFLRGASRRWDGPLDVGRLSGTSTC